jgi:hypothetical protein
MDDLVGAAEDARWGAGLGSTIGPVLLAVLLTALEDIGLVQAMDTAEQTILAPLQFIIHLSLAAGIWVVCCILASLHRVGLTNLRLDTTSGDPTLGLKPIGKIAVRTYALFAVGAAPILLANTDSAVALAINGGTFLIVTGFFVFALWGVHRQMATARDRVVGEARQRMRHIVGRIESRQDSDMTDQDATLVTAADILERRAREISGWPLTGGLYVRTGIILVGVLIGLITRAIGTALGV